MDAIYSIKQSLLSQTNDQSDHQKNDNKNVNVLCLKSPEDLGLLVTLLLLSHAGADQLRFQKKSPALVAATPVSLTAVARGRRHKGLRDHRSGAEHGNTEVKCLNLLLQLRVNSLKRTNLTL